MTSISRRTGAREVDLQVVKGGGGGAQSRSDTSDTDPVAEAPRLFLVSSFEAAKLPDALVLRTRLLDRVTRGVRDRAMTLISAPAGAGKSVLAAAWRAHNAVGWPVAWLTVGENSDRVLTFWAYVVEAMRCAGVPLEHVEQAMPLTGVDLALMTRLAADLLDLPEPLVLVIDGFDRVETPGVLDGVDFLLRHADPKFRLVLCGRGDPPLPIHRYRLADMVAEIGPDALGFTAAETQQLLVTHGLTMSSRTVRELVERTGGWAAGLRLAVASLHRAADGGATSAESSSDGSAGTLVTELSHCARTSTEYLRTEVLERLPTHLRDCLIRTSVSDRLWPDLVAALTGAPDGEHILAELARTGVFTELPRHGAGSYRVGPMFGDMLRAQLRHAAPADLAKLHEVCMQWFTDRGQRLPALRHAVAAGQWDHAARMMVEDLGVASLIGAGEVSDSVNLLMSIPADASGANAAVVQSALALGRHNVGVAIDRLHAARHLIDPRVAPVELMLSAALIELALGAETGVDTEGVELVEQARYQLNLLPADHKAAHPELDALIETYRGMALLGSGAEAPAIAAFEAGLKALGWPSVEAVTTIGPQLRCLNFLAVIHASHGRLRRAKDLGHAALRLAAGLRDRGRQQALGARVALAWVHLEQGEPTTAARWATQARDRLDRNAEPLLAPMLAIVEIRLLRSRGHAAEAFRLVDRLRAHNQTAPRWVRRWIALEAADIGLGLTRAEDAVEILDNIAQGTDSSADVLRVRAALISGAPCAVDGRLRLAPDGAPRVRVDALLAETCVHLSMGDEQSAARSVRRALRIAEPELMRRPFIESTAQIRMLIDNPSRPAVPGPSWLDPARPGPESARHRDACSVPSPAIATPVEPLTDRETEVLRNLADLLSTEEIAAAMFISVNTVRSHVRSILRKLAAPRRNVAVRRARDLQLV